jgi:hypothetical protein
MIRRMAVEEQTAVPAPGALALDPQHFAGSDVDNQVVWVTPAEWDMDRESAIRESR